MTPKIIFLTKTGSRAYNLHNEQSDHDYRGVFLAPFEQILGFRANDTAHSWEIDRYCPQVDIKEPEENKESTYYELERFIHLLNIGNPGMLEMIFSDPSDWVVVDPLFKEMIINNREQFLTKDSIYHILAYAKKQIIKATGLNKKSKWESEGFVRRDISEFCKIYKVNNIFDFKKLRNPDLFEKNTYLVKVDGLRNTYRCIYDTQNRDEASIFSKDRTQIVTKPVPEDLLLDKSFVLLYFNLEAFQQHCKEFREYEAWLETRNKTRYGADEAGNTFDRKNMMHCLRLLHMANHAIDTGELLVKITGDLETHLRAVRNGEVSYDDIMAEANSLFERAELLKKDCKLPDIVKEGMMPNILVDMRENYYIEPIIETSQRC